MSDNVVEMGEKKDTTIKVWGGEVSDVSDIKELQPHNSGEFLCLVCDYSFISVAPLDELWVECPQCLCERATHKFPIDRAGYSWSCDCGNDLFRITPDGNYCPNCGVQVILE